VRPLNMRVGLVVSTPERTEKYLIDVDEYNWEWSVAISRHPQPPPGYWVDMPAYGRFASSERYEKRIKATFSGILLAYPPLPGLPLKD